METVTYNRESEDASMDVERADQGAQDSSESIVDGGGDGDLEQNDAESSEVQVPTLAELDTEFRKYSFLRPMRRWLPFLQKKVESRRGKQAEEENAPAVIGEMDNNTQCGTDVVTVTVMTGGEEVKEIPLADAEGGSSGKSDEMVIEESKNERQEEGEVEIQSSDIDNQSAATSQDTLAMPPAIAIGEFVEVASRCWPGMNKQGGAGKVKKVEWDEEEQEHLYRVQYILGGSESGIQEKYIRKRDILGGSDTASRKEGLQGRCRYCPSFIRDCGHSQEDRPEELAESSIKLKKRRGRSRGDSGQPEALIDRLIEKREKRRGSGVGDSLARLLEWRVASGLVDKSSTTGGSQAAADRSARAPKKPAPRRFAALSGSSSGSVPSYSTTSSSSGSISVAPSAVSAFPGGGRGVAAGQRGPKGSDAVLEGLGQELSPQQVSALIAGAVAATEKHTRGTLEGLHSPDDEFLRPEHESDLGLGDSGMTAYAPRTLLSIASQCLDCVQGRLSDASALRNRVIAFNASLTEAAGTLRRREGGLLSQLQEGVGLASQIIGLSDELAVLRSVVAVALQDRVSASLAQWRRLGKSCDRRAATDCVRALKHKMRDVRGRADVLAEAWRAEEDSVKRAQRRVEERFEQIFGLSPLDYAIEHGEDAAEGDTSSEDDSGGSVFSSESDEEDLAVAVAQAQRKRKADSGSGGGGSRRLRPAGAGSGGPVVKRARRALDTSSHSARGAGAAAAAIAGSGEDGDSDFEAEEGRAVLKSGANESRPRGQVLLVDRHSSAKASFSSREGLSSTRRGAGDRDRDRDRHGGASGKHVTSASLRGLAVRRASLEGEKENRPLYSRPGASEAGAGGRDILELGSAGPVKRPGNLSSIPGSSRGPAGPGAGANAPRRPNSAPGSTRDRYEDHFSSARADERGSGTGKRGSGGHSEGRSGVRRRGRLQHQAGAPGREGNWPPRTVGAALMHSLDPIRRKPSSSSCPSSSSSPSSFPSLSTQSSARARSSISAGCLPLFAVGSRRIRNAGGAGAGAAGDQTRGEEVILEDDEEEDEYGDGEEDDAVESFLSCSLHVEADRSRDRDRGKGRVTRPSKGDEGVERQMATLLQGLMEESKSRAGEAEAEAEAAPLCYATRLVGTVCTVSTHALHVATAQLRAHAKGGDAQSKGADSRVDRATTLLLLLLRGSPLRSPPPPSSSSDGENAKKRGGGGGGGGECFPRPATLLPLLAPRLAHFEQHVMFPLLLPASGAPNACLHLVSDADAGTHSVASAPPPDDPLHQGCSLAALLYEATIDPLHDNLVGCALHYLTHKVRLYVAEVSALAAAAPAPSGAVAGADERDTYACVFAAAECLVRAWDDLSLALVLNPSLVARCLKLASQEGLEVLSPPDATAEDEAESLSFKEWYRQHQHRRRLYAYDASRSLWFLRFWSSLVAASHAFSSCLSSPALKPLLGPGPHRGLLPAELTAFRSDPWLPLLRRLGTLYSLSGFPYVGTRLSCFPRLSPGGRSDGAPGSASEIPQEGCSPLSADAAIVSVSPYLSAMHRDAATKLQQRDGSTTEASAECLWAAVALNTLLVQRAPHLQQPRSAVSPTSPPSRVRNAWALVELLLRGDTAVVTRGLRRAVALSSAWDESADGTRIVVTRVCRALTATKGGIPLSLVMQNGGPQLGRPSEAYKGALEAAAAAALATISSYPPSAQILPAAPDRASLQVPLGRLVAALYLESGLEVPVSLVPGSRASLSHLPAAGLYEGLDLVPPVLHSFLHKSTSNADGAGQSKILVKRVLAVLRKTDTSLLGLLARVREISRGARFDLPVELTDPLSEGYSPSLMPKMRALTLVGRATTTLLFLAAASAALGSEALHSSPQASALEVLSTVLPWGEDEILGDARGETVTLCREQHACLMWLVALVVHHPASLLQPSGSTQAPRAHISTGAALHVSLAPLVSLLTSLPLIIASDQQESASGQFRRVKQAVVPLSPHCTRQLLVALAAGSAVVHSLASAPALTEELLEALWSLLSGQSSLGTLIALGLRHGPPRSGLGCVAVRACIVCLRAITRLRAAVSESEESAQAWAKKGRAPVLAHARACYVEPLRSVLPKLMTGGAEAAGDYDPLAPPMEEAPLSADPLPDAAAAAAPARRKGHLHALAVGSVSAIADWAASLCVADRGAGAGTSGGTEAVQVDVAGTVASLQSVRSFDSPLSSWLECVLWTPVIKALLALTRAQRAPLHGIEEEADVSVIAPSDARLLLESCVPSLHLTYLVLLGTSAVQRKVVRTIDVSSFENSLAEITLYCASDEGASRSSGSARCAAFWQKLGKNRPFQGGAAPSGGTIIRSMISLSYKLCLLPAPAPGKSPPLSAVCHTLTRLCRFVNQMAFHSVQSARDNVLLPFAMELKFKVILGSGITAAGGADWTNQAILGASKEQLLSLFEEGAGFRRDIAMAEAMLIGVNRFPDGSAAATAATDMLQYVPIVVRSCATRQYATAVRGWEPLLAMLAHACSASNLWRSSHHSHHSRLYRDLLYTWAVALVDRPLSSSGIAGNLGGVAVRRLVQGAGPGIAVVTGIYKHAQEDLTEDPHSLDKLHGFARFLLCSRGHEQFRSDVLWRRVISEMVSRSASDGDEKETDASKYTEKWLNATVVASRIRLAIARAASRAYFTAPHSEGHLEVVGGELAELHVALVVSSTIVGLQLLRVLRGDALADIDPSYHSATPAGDAADSDRPRAAEELSSMLELALFSEEARAALRLRPADENEGEEHASHAATMQRSTLRQWRIFLGYVGRGGARGEGEEGDDSQEAGAGAGLVSSVDTLTRLLKRWICCQSTSLAGCSDTRACGCSACSSPLVWDALARHRVALEDAPEDGVVAANSPYLAKLRGALEGDKGTTAVEL